MTRKPESTFISCSNVHSLSVLTCRLWVTNQATPLSPCCVWLRWRTLSRDLSGACPLWVWNLGLLRNWRSRILHTQASIVCWSADRENRTLCQHNTGRMWCKTLIQYLSINVPHLWKLVKVNKIYNNNNTPAPSDGSRLEMLWLIGCWSMNQLVVQ